MKLHLKALLVVILIGGGATWAFQHFFLSKLRKDGPTMEISTLETWEKEGLPNFEAKDLDGKTVNFKDFEGRVVIVNFWASWCGPCIEEVPSLIKLIKEFDGKVQLIAISGDSNREDIDVFLKSFPELKAANITLIWDEDRSLMKLYNITRLPESMVADKSLRMVKKLAGSIDWYTADSKAYMGSLLAK